MILTDLNKIDEILKEYCGKEVSLVTHENPDGDGLCACMALALCLREIYSAKPTIVMDSDYPTSLEFLHYTQFQILKYSEYIKNHTTLPLLLVLDCHEKDRVDTDKKIFDIANQVIVLEHHIAKPECLKDEYFYYIDKNAVSTGVIIHRFLHKYAEKMSIDARKNYADFIYTTILNDTDNFLNSNTDFETFTTAADLMKLGLQPNDIANKFLYTKPTRYFQFIGQVLSTMEITGKIATYYSTLQMLKDHQLNYDGYSKMMRWTKGAFDTDIHIFFAEYDDDLWRISLRSSKHNVAQIAQHFGGGGHFRASGFQLTGKFNDIKKQVIDYIENQI